MAQEDAYLIHTFEHRAYPLTRISAGSQEALTIGRDADNDVVIREVTVSRQHAEIYKDGDEYVLHGTGVTGALVNDKPAVFPHILHEGDKITIGTMNFVFTHSALPIGISIIDRKRAEPLGASIETRRPTIVNPILRDKPGEEKWHERYPNLWLWIVAAVLVLFTLFLRYR